MLYIITIDETEKWDDLVRSFKAYDVNYLSGYAKTFQLHGDGEPLLFYYDDGSTKAMNVVMKRDIAHDELFKNKLLQNTYFDLSTPYGYGGFWIEGEDSEAVNEAYDIYCRDNGFVSEFVRFHLFSDYQPHFNGLSETHTHNVVRTLELPLDEMLMDFEHKVRKNLKKAEKTGLEVQIDTNGERLDEFLEIYYGTMDRTAANKDFFFPKDFFESLNMMEGNYIYIHVLYEDKVISTELVLYGTENCYSFLGGTNRDYFDLRPNDFLKYEIIKWAREKGLKRFILGGGYGEDDGIFRYKKSLAPSGVCDYYIGKKIFDKNKYKKLLEIRKEEDGFDVETQFFPKYRGKINNDYNLHGIISEKDGLDMNIIFLSIGGLRDLSENAVYPDLLRYFRDKGHSVHIVCQREKRSDLQTEMLIEHGMKVLRVKTGNITKSNLIEKGIATLMIGNQFKDAINKYFGDIKFDIVLYSTPPITIANTVSFLKKRDNAFTYLMLKDIFPQNALDIGLLKKTGWKGLATHYFFATEKKLYGLSDSIGCMSDANVKFLMENNLYLATSKIEVCPNTINPIAQHEVDKIILRDKFNLPKEKIIFVYGGNFGKPQDVDYIIDILKNNEKKSNCHFVMCGSGTDFYKIKEFEKNADDGYITVLDSLGKQEYDSLLEACDVGLVFLDHRFTIPNFPSRLLDYMNHGLPVIAATDKNTDIGEVITKGNFGWWCESNNVNSYHDILDKVISNPVLIREKGILGRKYLEENYHTSVAYERIMGAYNDDKARVEESNNV